MPFVSPEDLLYPSLLVRLSENTPVKAADTPVKVNEFSIRLITGFFGIPSVTGVLGISWVLQTLSDSHESGHFKAGLHLTTGNREELGDLWLADFSHFSRAGRGHLGTAGPEAMVCKLSAGGPARAEHC